MADIPHPQTIAPSWENIGNETLQQARALSQARFGAGRADAEFLYQNALIAYMEAIKSKAPLSASFSDNLFLCAFELTKIRRAQGVLTIVQILSAPPLESAIKDEKGYLRARARLIALLLMQKETFKPNALDILGLALGKIAEGRSLKRPTDQILLAMKVNWDGKLSANPRQRVESYKAVDAAFVSLRRQARRSPGNFSLLATTLEEIYTDLLMDRADGENDPKQRSYWLQQARTALDDLKKHGASVNIQEARLAALSQHPHIFVAALIDESSSLRFDPKALLNAIEWALGRDDTAIAVLNSPEADGFVLLENAMWEDNPTLREAILKKASHRLEEAPFTISLALVQARLAVMTKNNALLQKALEGIPLEIDMPARLYAFRSRPGDPPHPQSLKWEREERDRP